MGGGGSSAAKAAKIQAEATRYAADQMVAQLEKNRAMQETVNQQNIQYLKEQDAGNKALMAINQGKVLDTANDYNNAYKNYNDVVAANSGQITMDNFQQSDYYNYLQSEQQRALNNSLVGQSGLLSGNAARATLTMSNNIANSAYNDYFNQQQALRGSNIQNALGRAGLAQNAVNTFIGASQNSTLGTDLVNQNNNYYATQSGINNAIGQTQGNAAIGIGDINAKAEAAKKSGLQGALAGAGAGAMAGSAAGPWGALAGGVIGGIGGYSNAKSGGGAETSAQQGTNSGNALASIFNMFSGNNSSSSLFSRAS